MIWQDLVIALVQLGFVGALVPTAACGAGRAVPLMTSGPTGGGLAIIATCMASLGLWWSAATAAGCAVLWALIAIQRLRARP